MTSPRPTFDPPTTALPSLQHYGHPTDPAPPTTPVQPAAPVPSQPPHPSWPPAVEPVVEPATRARRRRRVVVGVVVAVVVLAVVALVASVASTLGAAPDLGRDTPDQPEYAAPVLPGTVPLDASNDCYEDFNSDVASAMTDIGVSYDGVDCPDDTDVVVSLPGRYPRARLISVAEQLLARLYDAGWDIDRVEVYDAAGTGGFYTW